MISNPLSPMLAVDIESDSKTRVLDYYLKTSFWGISQKVDGKRIVVRTDGEDYTVYNRRGETIDGKFPDALKEDLSRLGTGYLLDGELIEDKYVTFDLIFSPEHFGITPESPYHLRYEILKLVTDMWEPENVTVLPFIYGSDMEAWNEESASIRLTKIADKKKQFFRSLQMNGAEGAIFRSIESQYMFGKRSPSLLKYKFWKTVDCIVYNTDRGKLSVGVALLEGGEPVDVGAVTVTQSVLTSVQVGDVMEVRYLYATDSRRLYQASFIKIRDDKKLDECLITQLHYTNRKVLDSEDCRTI